MWGNNLDNNNVPAYLCEQHVYMQISTEEKKKKKRKKGRKNK